MILSVKKTYKFAFRTSSYITLILTLLLGVFLYQFNEDHIWLTIPFLVLTFTLSFLIIQYRAEKFIYRRVKKIYDELTLLESSSLIPKSITTDMSSLTQEIDRFAKNKKLEIETLKVREEYRKEFMGNVSHELKTPLFTVQGYLETLVDGGINDLEIRDKYLKRAVKGLERLIYIVKDLDMITKLEVGDLSLKIEKFTIIDLVLEVFELFEMKASKKSISLTLDRDYDKPVWVYADRERIQQVLSNLVVNSIKYGREKGTTELSVESISDEKVIIRVTDNGEGIEEEHISRLFERFYRVDMSRSRQIGGSGLGLSIVKHIVEAHQEQIYVESEIAVGSEFSFTLNTSNKSSGRTESN
jgi:two-component system phosphate regulon sensor histidine kinase PhoR